MHQEISRSYSTREDAVYTTQISSFTTNSACSILCVQQTAHATPCVQQTTGKLYTPRKPRHTLSSLSSISFNSSSSLRGLSTAPCAPYFEPHTQTPTIPFISPISTSALETIGTIAFVSENEIEFVPIPLFSSLELIELSAPPTFLATSPYPLSPPTIQNSSTVNTSTAAEEATLRMDSAITTRSSKKTIPKATDVIKNLTQVSNKHQTLVDKN